MAASFTLSEAELRELTGAVRKTRQAAWLAERSIRYEFGADGRIKVARHAAEAFMGGPKARTKTPRGPDLGALKKAS